ncbi:MULTISPECIES: tetratricopeptide repeat protein [unclassified Streptomyces]|uniref:ATP-binding protein n=1 Tax=unclassified Streptomyces TaxID=2593676 RepID=UPI00336A20B0
MNTPGHDSGRAPDHIEVHAHDHSRVYVANRDLHQTIVSVPTPVTTLRTLPRKLAYFTGRGSELHRLLQAVGPHPGQTVAIHTISGMPGVGKTALATHVAHLLSNRYPDGQLFVQLNAHTPGQRQADPANILATLLTSSGIAPRHLPDGIDARAALWRNHLATRRILLVLDDAADSAQIEPLLPANEECLVLVTSRKRLLGLDGAVPLSLECLQPDQAALLFGRLANRNPTSLEGKAIASTVRLCGYLPLAITLLAAQLAHHPLWDINTFADNFATAQDRLGELEAGDRAVTAAFRLSYKALDPHQKNLFRCLGLHPGPEIDAYATAALADISVNLARRRLNALYKDHLVDESTAGRYRLHDLLRTYARDLAVQVPARDRALATDRLLAYYQHAAEAADLYLADTARPGTPTPTPACPTVPRLTTREDALLWMRTERPNLFACVEYATTRAQPSRVIRLVAAMAAFLRREGPWPQAIALHETAIHTSNESGARLSKANAMWDLGRVQYLVGAYDAAAKLLEESHSQYSVLCSRLGEANALWDLGLLHRLTGRYDLAIKLLEKARIQYHFIGDQIAEANALRDLGRAQCMVGKYEPAIALMEKALTLYQTGGDRFGEANTLRALGRALCSIGDHDRAISLLEKARAIYKDLDNSFGEANALRGMGLAQREAKNYETAIDLAEQARSLYKTLSNQLGETNTLHDLGRAQYLVGDVDRAVTLMKQALDLYEILGNQLGKAEVLNGLGKILSDSSQPEKGIALHREALQLARKLTHPLEEAHALEGAARCAARTGSRQTALVDLQSAVEIYKRIGAAEASAAMAFHKALQIDTS